MTSCTPTPGTRAASAALLAVLLALLPLSAAAQPAPLPVPAAAKGIPLPAATAAQPTLAAAQPVLEPRFAWPLSPAPSVVRPFDAPEQQPYGPGHRGVDLAAGDGQQVLAAGAGYVVFAGDVAGRGVMSVEHDGGLRTTYEPVQPMLATGDQVSQGQPIGTVVAGHPECTATACLHWGVRRGEEYLDPLRLVVTYGALRLKPWEGVPS
ncbi:M23 family metallopeptidase [Saccharomonospora sp. NPDC046836]|uniref:murein hydrolase activator EnvC family protein n=1 Tax=Saccharomonospora sp. NPDC046836 TaxID=3156921 RepID=UPI0033F03CCE